MFDEEKNFIDPNEMDIIIDEKKTQSKLPIFNKNIFSLCKQTRTF